MISACCEFDLSRHLEKLEHPTAGEQRTGNLRCATSQPIDQAVRWKFVAAVIDSAETVMWKPVLVAVDSNQILDREGDTGFFMCFELR